jgi:hypothetical protein
MFSASSKSQHFAEYYSIDVNEKGCVIRKVRGYGLPSIGQTRLSRLELCYILLKVLKAIVEVHETEENVMPFEATPNHNFKHPTCSYRNIS